MAADWITNEGSKDSEVEIEFNDDDGAAAVLTVRIGDNQGGTDQEIEFVATEPSVLRALASQLETVAQDIEDSEDEDDDDEDED